MSLKRRTVRRACSSSAPITGGPAANTSAALVSANTVIRIVYPQNPHQSGRSYNTTRELNRTARVWPFARPSPVRSLLNERAIALVQWPERLIAGNCRELSLAKVTRASPSPRELRLPRGYADRHPPPRGHLV